jgi:hypothetical protein
LRADLEFLAPYIDAWIEGQGPPQNLPAECPHERPEELRAFEERLNRPRSMETKMRNKVLTVLGVLLIAAALTIQVAAAAARHARKAAHAPVPVTQQLRERHRLSAPAAIHNRSCDIIWCYED